MSVWSRLKSGFRQAGNGAVTGAVTLSVLWHWYNIYTDSPALRDGQYAMFPIITAPPGALVGGIIGFIAGIVSGDEEEAPERAFEKPGPPSRTGRSLTRDGGFRTGTDRGFNPGEQAVRRAL